jgi:thymidine phosphorylase
MSPESLTESIQDGTVSPTEIQSFVNHVISNSSTERWDDSQVETILKAIFVHGINPEATASLTDSMRNSGRCLEWPQEWKHLVVDKHSTGGVGDKVSIPLAPALTACGLKVPMISGRGLGHTGGTLDKLESLPGFDVQLSIEEILAQVEDIGIAMVGQTDDLVPADRRLYSIRDVTGTIASVPLITSSIVSKKAAESLSALVLDVKYGKAAFMVEKEDAQKLAKAMVDASNRCGIQTSAVLTTMDHPIGCAIGNALEVLESIETMRGNGPWDLEELVCAQGGALLHATGKSDTLENGFVMIQDSLHDGSALKCFIQMAISQGVNASVFDSEHSLCQSLGLLDSSLNSTEISSQTDGTVTDIDAMVLALVALDLGAGRREIGDKIDSAVGFILDVELGQEIMQGDTWVTVHHRGELEQYNRERIELSIQIGKNEFQPPSRIDSWVR